MPMNQDAETAECKLARKQGRDDSVKPV